MEAGHRLIPLAETLSWGQLGGQSSGGGGRAPGTPGSEGVAVERRARGSSFPSALRGPWVLWGA